MLEKEERRRRKRGKNEVRFARQWKGERGELSDKVARATVRTGLDVAGPSESQQVCVMDSVSVQW